jgi:16S rRNA (uracil1498-N3)-methyltransferase
MAETRAVGALLREVVDSGGTAVLLHEDAALRLASLPVPATGDVVLVVGPEGGITDDELVAFEAAGARAARLGPSVLRTSTAGAIAAALVLAATSRWT